MHIKCSLIDAQGNCLILNGPAIEGCKCPYYQITEIQKCKICGKAALKMPLNEIKEHNWEPICDECRNKFSTCAACTQIGYCAFQQDPSPIPPTIMQTIRQGPVVMQKEVPNPERIKITCMLCKCWNKELNQCNRNDRLCLNYDEVEI